MSARVYIGLGSNLGDREAALEGALAALASRGFELTARSSLYLTEPVGGPAQEWYLNLVAEGLTALAPAALLAACLDVERQLGRVRTVRFGPRVLDADVLLYGDEVRCEEALVLPHPRLHERRFVLVPLCEIAPEARHPRLGLSAAQMLERCSDRSRVVRHDAALAGA